MTDEARPPAASHDVFVPGLWCCPKCRFTLMQSNLNVADGSVTARDTPGDKCPNCDSPLWRVSWRQQAKELGERAEQELIRNRKLQESVELAYGLLWWTPTDRLTADGRKVYTARQALLATLDRDGQARGITAAREQLTTSHRAVPGEAQRSREDT